jgi:type II secretory pathway pseudopilin PulG
MDTMVKAWGKGLKNAFSLQELLVVLVILIIITAVAIPGFINLYKNAAHTQEEEIIANLQTAIKRYFSQEFSWPENNPFELLHNPPEYWICSWDECLRNSEYGQGRWGYFRTTSPDGYLLVCPHYNVWSQKGCAWQYYLSGEKEGKVELIGCGTH